MEASFSERIMGKFSFDSELDSNENFNKFPKDNPCINFFCPVQSPGTVRAKNRKNVIEISFSIN